MTATVNHQIGTIVRAAKQCLADVMREAEGAEPDGLRFEEIERSDDDRFWKVTLSYVVPVASQSPFPGLEAFAPKYKRVFKVVHVDDSNRGLAIKLRE